MPYMRHYKRQLQTHMPYIEHYKRLHNYWVADITLILSMIMLLACFLAFCAVPISIIQFLVASINSD